MVKSWLALIAAPSTALAVQSVMYALVTPSCARQSTLWIHAAAAAALAFCVVLTLLAALDWTRYRAGPSEPADSDSGGRGPLERFVGTVATAVAAMSAFVILVMWMGAWLLSPCSPVP